MIGTQRKQLAVFQLQSELINRRLAQIFRLPIRMSPRGVFGSGKIFRKAGRICTRTFSVLEDVYKRQVILPCNLFLSFLDSGGVEMLRASLVTVGLSVVTIVGSSALGWLLYRRMAPQKRAVFQYGIANSNALFIGLPIIQDLLGADGVLQLSMYLIFARVFVWTYGLSLYTGTQGNRRDALKKLVTQPAMIAAYLGIAAMLTGLRPVSYTHLSAMISEMANRPISSTTRAKPLLSWYRPKVKRGLESIGARPTVASSAPSTALIRPLGMSWPVRAMTIDREKIASAQYSYAWNFSAKLHSTGDSTISRIRPMIVPMKENTTPVLCNFCLLYTSRCV